MPKVKSLADIKEKLKAVLDEFVEALEASPEKPAKSKKAEAEAESEDEAEDDDAEGDDDESEDAEGEVSVPEPDDVAGMKGAAIDETLTKLGIDGEGFKAKEKKQLLLTVSKIVAEETDDLTKAEVNALCEAIGVEPAKKLEKSIEAIVEYLESDDAPAEAEEDADADAEEESEEEEEDSEEEDSEEESEDDDEDDDEDEDEDDSEDDSEEVDDGVDRKEVAAEYDDYPAEAEMKKRLAAFNEAAEDEIPIKKGKVKASYQKLVEELVDSEGDVAEWGDAYVRNGEAYCCGVPLEETKGPKKGVQYGKCAVTGKVFYLNEDDEFVPLKKK